MYSLPEKQEYDYHCDSDSPHMTVTFRIDGDSPPEWMEEFMKSLVTRAPLPRGGATVEAVARGRYMHRDERPQDDNEGERIMETEVRLGAVAVGLETLGEHIDARVVRNAAEEIEELRAKNVQMREALDMIASMEPWTAERYQAIARATMRALEGKR